MPAFPIAEIERIIGYHFKNPRLLQQAFTRTSYCNEARQGGDSDVQSNEVLEFCGDSVLSTAIVTVLMKKYATQTKAGLTTPLDEGAFSTIKSNLTNKKTLGEQMEKTGLAEHLLLGQGDVRKKIWQEPSVREDLFESIIGAVYFDCGENLSTVIPIVEGLLDTDGYLKKSLPTASPKNLLQEWCQDKHRKAAFSYETVGKEGPEENPTFTVVCRVLQNGKSYEGRGRGRNQKKAEEEAARAVLLLLK